MSVQVIKADGSRQLFDITKLEKSLHRAGADKDEIRSILIQVENILYDGIKTQEIYSKAFQLLRESQKPTAARYSLRRALFGLGPTGFPFEDFLAKLFETEGYQTRTGITLQGKCVEHELDVAGFKEDHAFVAEAKFHARPGIKSDLQVAMYSYARQLDLMGQKICNEDYCGIKEFKLITNTKFTTTAVKYAECVGIKLLSWDYPKNDNLHDLIQRSGLYPVTVLQSLQSAHKKALLDRGTILCNDIGKNPALLRHIHLSEEKIDAVLSEVRQLCKLD